MDVEDFKSLLKYGIAPPSFLIGFCCVLALALFTLPKPQNFGVFLTLLGAYLTATGYVHDRRLKRGPNALGKHEFDDRNFDANRTSEILRAKAESKRG
jgi:hypothetical protein